MGVAFSIIANFVRNADPGPESELKICPKIPDITDIRKIFLSPLSLLCLVIKYAFPERKP